MSNAKTIQILRASIRKEIASQLKEESSAGESAAMSMDKKVQMIVKVAGQGLKAVKLLRSLPDPTQKVKEAVESNTISLEHVFNHMLSAPMEYLDEDPQAVVDAHKAKLDSRQAALAGPEEALGGAPAYGSDSQF